MRIRSVVSVIATITLASCERETSSEGPTARLSTAITAASPALADVQAAVNTAVDGDTVNIPAGTATWTTGLTITKGITLHGQTTTAGGGTANPTTDDQTIIVDETTKTIGVIQMNSDKPYRITGITFRGGTTPPNPAGHATLVLSNGTGKLNPAVRADHLHFDGPSQRCIWQDGWMYGVIDNVVMHTTRATASFYMTMPTWNGEQFGNGSWADYAYFGSEKFMFIEDCSIIAVNGAGGMCDNMNGGRWVARHNYWKDCAPTGHGTESGPQRGNRADQWYDNILDFTLGSSQIGQSRSGNQIIHDNTWIDRAPSNGSLGQLAVYRMGLRAQLWDYAQGTNGWDNNDPQLYDSGTVAAVGTPAPGEPKDQRVLSVTGKNWTKDQWANYSITNTTLGQAPYHGIVLKGNTANTLIVKTNYASDVPQAQWIQWNAGDSYEIHKVIHSLDSAGAGKGDLIRIQNGVPVNQVDGKQKSNPHQMQENSYSWNNVVTKTGQVLGLTGEYCVLERRDFFNLGGGFPKDTIPQSVKDFYTAANNGVAYTSEYTYPHPLRSGGGGTPAPTGTPPIASPTATRSPSPSATQSPTPTPTPSATASQTPSPTPTATATPFPSPTPPPTPTPVPTLPPTPTATETPIATVAPTATASPTATLSPTPTPEPTLEPSATPSQTPEPPTPTPLQPTPTPGQPMIMVPSLYGVNVQRGQQMWDQAGFITLIRATGRCDRPIKSQNMPPGSMAAHDSVINVTR